MNERREFFTGDGGYVLMAPADRAVPDGEPVRFACTAGDTDQGVHLQDHELLGLGLWLLDQVMDEWERGQVHRLLQLTRRRLQLDPEPEPVEPSAVRDDEDPF